MWGSWTGIWLVGHIRARDWKAVDSQSIHVILIPGLVVQGVFSFCNAGCFFFL